MKSFCFLALLAGTLIITHHPVAEAVKPAPAKLEWLHDYETALKKSRETGKPIFVDCFAEWCIWCHKMEDEVYSDSKFANYIQNYILLRIDIDDRAEGMKFAEQFGVETLPTVIVIDSNGLMINRIGGYRDTKQLIDDLSMMQGLLDRERSNPDDWVAVKTLAEEYLFRDMNSDAEKRFSRILILPVNDYEKESAMFSLALAQYYQQKPDEALRTLNVYLETYVDGRSTEEVLLLLSQIYLEKNLTDKAGQVLKQFLRIFPTSEAADRVREILSKL